MKLLTYPGNPRAWKVLIVAQYAGVRIEVPGDFQFLVDNRKPEFYRLSPTGQVPVLMLDDGRGVFESTAVARYVAKVGGRTELLGGDDAYTQAQVDAFCDLAACGCPLSAGHRSLCRGDRHPEASTGRAGASPAAAHVSGGRAHHPGGCRHVHVVVLVLRVRVRPGDAEAVSVAEAVVPDLRRPAGICVGDRIGVAAVSEAAVVRAAARGGETDRCRNGDDRRGRGAGSGGWRGGERLQKGQERLRPTAQIRVQPRRGQAPLLQRGRLARGDESDLGRVVRPGGLRRVHRALQVQQRAGQDVHGRQPAQRLVPAHGPPAQVPLRLDAGVRQQRRGRLVCHRWCFHRARRRRPGTAHPAATGGRRESVHLDARRRIRHASAAGERFVCLGGCLRRHGRGIRRQARGHRKEFQVKSRGIQVGDGRRLRSSSRLTTAALPIRSTSPVCACAGCVPGTPERPQRTADRARPARTPGCPLRPLPSTRATQCSSSVERMDVPLFFTSLSPLQPSHTPSSSSSLFRDRRLSAAPLKISACTSPPPSDEPRVPRVGAPQAPGRPSWLRVPATGAALPNSRFRQLQAGLRARRLATVCEEAQCPNIGECWNVDGAAAAGRRRADARRRRSRHLGRHLRGAHQRGPRRLARRRRGAFRPHRALSEGALAGGRIGHALCRVSGVGFRRRRSGGATVGHIRPGRVRAQRGDRAAAATICRPAADHQDVADARPGRDRRRSAADHARSAGARRGRVDARAVSASVGAPFIGGEMGDAGHVRQVSAHRRVDGLPVRGVGSVGAQQLPRRRVHDDALVGTTAGRREYPQIGGAEKR
eukprot:ctg_979.g329